MARISEIPREKPEKKALKEFILSLKFRKTYDKKLGEVKFAARVDFYKFARRI